MKLKSAIKYGAKHYRDAYRLVYDKQKPRGSLPIFVMKTRGSEEADLALIFHEALKRGYPSSSLILMSLSNRQFASEYRRILSKVKTEII